MQPKPGINSRVLVWPLLVMALLVLALATAGRAGAQGDLSACIDSYDRMRVVSPVVEDFNDVWLNWLHSLYGQATDARMFLGYSHEYGDGDYPALLWPHWNMPAGARLFFLAIPRGGLGWRHDYRFVMVYQHADYPGRFWIWTNSEPETINSNGNGYHGTCAALVDVGASS